MTDTIKTQKHHQIIDPYFITAIPQDITGYTRNPVHLQHTVLPGMIATPYLHIPTYPSTKPSTSQSHNGGMDWIDLSQDKDQWKVRRGQLHGVSYESSTPSPFIAQSHNFHHLRKTACIMCTYNVDLLRTPTTIVILR
jgi:hypothetical protein